MSAGDILNYEYTGAVQTVTLPAGVYRLECWGAQGGRGGDMRSRVDGGDPGLGGYSVGTLVSYRAETLYIYVGGRGQDRTPNPAGSTNPSAAGGFNGGGSGWNSGSTSGSGGGGGGSDIRIGTDSLYARVIVAGGGGSTGWNKSYAGGCGGGLIGGAGESLVKEGGPGGTQTGGGSLDDANPGSFGQGGNGGATLTTRNAAGAGGGGWYGGSSGVLSCSGGQCSNGGGGSGYVFTEETAGDYPAGCLLSSLHHLSGASTIGGDQTFEAPDGEQETGHAGDGYVRITVLDQWIISDLIYDRTKADVARVSYLRGLWKYDEDTGGLIWTGTAAELEAWNNAKGAYNAADLNRVEGCSAFVAQRLYDVPDDLKAYAESLGVAWDAFFDVPYKQNGFKITTKMDWSMTDFPTQSQMTRYLGNVKLLVTALEAAYPTLPESMDRLDWQGANAIERALAVLYDALVEEKVRITALLDRTPPAFIYSGEVFAGEV